MTLPIMLLLLLLAGCKTAEETTAQTANISDARAFALAREGVLAALKDPDSAKFGPKMVRKTYSWNGEEIVCGTVNAKNGFGGYTGMTPFVYRIAEGEAIVAPGTILWCN